MGAHHLEASEEKLVSTKRTRIIMAALLIPVFLATLVGLWVLWPSDAPERGTIQATSENARKVYGTVIQPPQDDDLALVELHGSGEQVDVIVPPEYIKAGIEVGDQFKILHIPEAAASGSPYVFMDFKRDVPILWLAIVYVVVVLAVARWRGLAAIAGLIVAFFVIVGFTLPAILGGSNAIGVALVTSFLVMFAVLYLAHGFNTKTSVALLGTIIGLLFTTALAAWAVDASNIGNLNDEYYLVLPAYAPQINLSTIALCGIVLAGLGVLNDVTITQSTAVWELRAANPRLTRAQLFGRGMRIGQHHIASTVYTIAFAYLGAALPMLLVVSLINMSLGETLTSGEIATEVVRTLVGSIGLVLAIPITTAIAAVCVKSPLSSADNASPTSPVGSEPSTSPHGRVQQHL